MQQFAKLAFLVWVLAWGMTSKSVASAACRLSLSSSMQPLIGPRHQPLPLLCTADTSHYMWANLPIAVALVAVGTWIFLHVDIQAKNMPGRGDQHIPIAEGSSAAALLQTY